MKDKTLNNLHCASNLLQSSEWTGLRTDRLLLLTISNSRQSQWSNASPDSNRYLRCSLLEDHCLTGNLNAAYLLSFSGMNQESALCFGLMKPSAGRKILSAKESHDANQEKVLMLGMIYVANRIASKSLHASLEQINFPLGKLSLSASEYQSLPIWPRKTGLNPVVEMTCR